MFTLYKDGADYYLTFFFFFGSISIKEYQQKNVEGWNSYLNASININRRESADKF